MSNAETALAMISEQKIILCSNLYSSSLDWENLDNEEIFRQTRIRLNKKWLYYFTNFHEDSHTVHKETCPFKDRYNRKICVCSSETELRMQATLKAGSYSIGGSARGRFFFVNVLADKGIDRDKLVNPLQRPDVVLEALRQGLETIASLLKVYEVTEKILDFGPPMLFYREGERKQRYDMELIDGDRLYAIIYDKSITGEVIQERKKLNE